MKADLPEPTIVANCAAMPDDWVAVCPDPRTGQLDMTISESPELCPDPGKATITLTPETARNLAAVLLDWADATK